MTAKTTKSTAATSSRNKAGTGKKPETLPVPPEPVAGGVITVTCHRPEGRRRVGRRWDHGATEVPVGELSDLDIAKLEADPQFTIVKPAV